MSPGLVAVLLVCGLPFAVVIGFFVIWALKITRVNGRRPEADAQETKTIQELYQGLLRMEERIEALETILMDQDGKRDEDEYEIK